MPYMQTRDYSSAGKYPRIGDQRPSLPKGGSVLEPTFLRPPLGLPEGSPMTPFLSQRSWPMPLKMTVVSL